MSLIKRCFIETKSGIIYEDTYAEEYNNQCEYTFNLAIKKDYEKKETIGTARTALIKTARKYNLCRDMPDKGVLEFLNSDSIKRVCFIVECFGKLSCLGNGGYSCLYIYDLKQDRICRYIRNLATNEKQRWEESDEDLTKQKIYPVGSIVFTRDNLYWLVKYDSWHDRMVLRASNIFSNMYLCKGIGKDNDYMAQIHFEDIIACVDINGNPLGAVIPESIHDKRIYEYEICYRARY